MNAGRLGRKGLSEEQSEGRGKVLIKKLLFFVPRCTARNRRKSEPDKTDEVDKSLPASEGK